MYLSIIQSTVGMRFLETIYEAVVLFAGEVKPSEFSNSPDKFGELGTAIILFAHTYIMATRYACGSRAHPFLTVNTTDKPRMLIPGTQAVVILLASPEK